MFIKKLKCAAMMVNASIGIKDYMTIIFFLVADLI